MFSKDNVEKNGFQNVFRGQKTRPFRQKQLILTTSTCQKWVFRRANLKMMFFLLPPPPPPLLLLKGQKMKKKYIYLLKILERGLFNIVYYFLLTVHFS